MSKRYQQPKSVTCPLCDENHYVRHICGKGKNSEWACDICDFKFWADPRGEYKIMAKIEYERIYRIIRIEQRIANKYNGKWQGRVAMALVDSPYWWAAMQTLYMLRK